jgi:hypothetical protein
LTLASKDQLTGAWSREFGLAELARELKRAHRTGATLVLALVGIDGLKQVNDTEGRLAGDELLRLIGGLCMPPSVPTTSWCATPTTSCSAPCRTLGSPRLGHASTR